MTSFAVFSLVAAILLLAAALGSWAAIRYRTARVLAIRSPNGIVEERFVRVGGIDHWIQIRGEDRGNPILLFLHAHGMTMTPFAPVLRSWERHFTVVHWDRRTVGRTLRRNGRAGSETLTFDRLVEDGIELTEYLCRYLGQDRVVLLGHSQGTVVALRMARQRPDLFHAYVGTGQMFDMKSNEAITYERALDLARAVANGRAVRALEEIGPPPYRDASTWIVKLRWASALDPELAAFQRLALKVVLSSPRFSLREVLAFGSDPLFLPAPIFEETMRYDVRDRGTEFDVPFLVLHGAADFFAPPSLAEECVAVVQAPRKKLVLLEGAGHMAVLLRPEQFLAELLAHVRPLATPSPVPG